MRMPFGKFRGHCLEDLPSDYVEWLLTLELREPLLSAVEKEAERRIFSQERAGQVHIRILDELVGAGLRSLARKYHPDAGGTVEQMQAVNLAAEWVRQQARRIAA